jgi:hypothetical protein
LPDRRLLEQVMREVVPSARGARDDLSAAQDLVYQALATDDGETRVRLAQKALATCPDCADAYVLLAESTDSIDEAHRLYAEGVAAGRRALGREFDGLVGHFWGYLESRPYMRARAGLADTLWHSGRRDEAVEHYAEMLRLNPNDNQGLRYPLLSALIQLDRDTEAQALLERYDEDCSAHWVFSRALLAFRREGDSAGARKFLSAAQKANRHVVKYLLGERAIPSNLPEYVAFGSKEEAAGYVSGALGDWKETPGAITWARRRTASPPRPKHEPEPPELPPVPALPILLAVPQVEGETWQVGSRRLPGPFREENQLRHLWVLLVIENKSGCVMSLNLQAEPPDADMLRRVVAAAILHPAVGPSRRPAKIQVGSGDDLAALATLLDPLAVAGAVMPRLDVLNEAIDDLEKSLGTETPPLSGLLEIPGVSREQVGRFFEAAAAFFRQKPWRLVAGDRAFRVDAPGTGRGPWSGVVMGQSGVELGFALYDNPAMLKKVLSGQVSGKRSFDSMAAISVTYCEEDHVPATDVEAAEQFGWPIASPEAYPLAMRVDPGVRFRSPESWELELLTKCLEAIPGFLTDGKKQTSPVAMAADEIVLSWSEP